MSHPRRSSGNRSRGLEPEVGDTLDDTGPPWSGVAFYCHQKGQADARASQDLYLHHWPWGNARRSSARRANQPMDRGDTRRNRRDHAVREPSNRKRAPCEYLYLVCAGEGEWRSDIAPAGPLPPGAAGVSPAEGWTSDLAVRHESVLFLRLPGADTNPMAGLRRFGIAPVRVERW